MEKNKYKFRAECLTDVGFFLSRLQLDFVTCKITKEKNFPDVEIEIILIDTDLQEIMEVMLKGIDAHVMVESLNYANEYTGGRI